MNNETTKMWKDYENGLAYQKKSGLNVNIPKFVDFFEGRQWPAATKNTKALPRPVVNIIKLICRNKKSAILSTPVKIVYRAENNDARVTEFNDFADYIQDEMGMNSLDKKAVNDACVKGSYFYHFYWDSEAKGKDGKVDGGVRCEIIDPLNIFFSNPCETDEQKQAWIIIASRESVSSLKAKADEGVNSELIVADDNDNNSYNVVEQDESGLCTVLTRYFRKNGEVYCERAVKGTYINKAFAITPNIELAKKQLGFTTENNSEDDPNTSLNDKPTERSFESVYKATLYPIVAGSYEPKEKSIFGLSEVEGLIPNQKSINFMLAMALLNAQDMAWGKYIVSPDALRGQIITNIPGQQLIDYSKNGNGIRKMSEQPIQSVPITLVDTLTNLTRTVTGSTEVMTGEVIGANMSGAAIAQLQAQAQQPIEELRDSFWEVKKKQGKVLAQFFKLFYHNKSYTHPDPSNNEKKLVASFESGNYTDIEFDVVVEATGGTKSSAAGDINFLDLLLAKGAISLKLYARLYPEDALSNRSELLKVLEEEEQSELNQAKATIEQLTAQTEQLVEIVKNQQDTVDQVTSVIRENTQLNAIISNLYTESKSKIDAGNAKIKELYDDASFFADLLSKAGLVVPQKVNENQSTNSAAE